MKFLSMAALSASSTQYSCTYQPCTHHIIFSDEDNIKYIFKVKYCFGHIARFESYTALLKVS